MDQERDYVQILTSDFLKNSGIVAMLILLKKAQAHKGTDYRVHGNVLEIERNFFRDMDLTDLYFKCMIERYQEHIIVPKIIETVKRLIDYFDRGLEAEKEEEIRDGLSFISEKLSAASFKTGIESIRDQISDTHIYKIVTARSFKKSTIDSELCQKLCELNYFLNQDIVYETLCFKNIIYRMINKFWERSFLLRENAKKNMRECFERDFVEPLKQYLDADQTKMKDQCIDCGNPTDSHCGVSISFMKDFADDLARKKAAIFHYNIDMNLCPICAFLYALTPLGFVKYNRDFIFVNRSGSIKELETANHYSRDLSRHSIEEDFNTDKYQVVYQILEKYALDKQMRKDSEQLNDNSYVQIITRSMKDNEKVEYQFDILDSFLVDLLYEESGIVRQNLEYFVKKNVIKIKDTYISVFQEIMKRLLARINMYDLIQMLLRQAIEASEASYLASYAARIVEIQYCFKGGKNMSELHQARREGYHLRMTLIDKVNVDDAYRGTIYQLTNALKVDDREKFIDILLRIYASFKLRVPLSLGKILESENGLEIGYQFLLGFKGAYYDGNQQNKEGGESDE